MLFNSHEYLLLFLPATVLIYFTIGRWAASKSAQKLWLIAASLFFYGYMEPRYVWLLIFSVVFNFLVAGAITQCSADQSAKKRCLLMFGTMVDVALLGYYKYAHFVLANINDLFHSNIAYHPVALPLGLSFITFIQISHLVDSYRRPGSTSGFLDYGVAGSFFPYLLAGPIVRPLEIVSQVKDGAGPVNYRHFSLGLYLISLGLFKKVVIADQFSEWVTAGFDQGKELNFLYAWVTSLSYTIQIS